MNWIYEQIAALGIVYLMPIGILAAVALFALWHSNGFGRFAAVTLFGLGLVIHACVDEAVGTAVAWLAVGWLVGFSVGRDWRRADVLRPRSGRCQETE